MGDYSDVKNYIKEANEKYGFSFIPLRFVPDDGGKNGKIPAIKDWSQYCDEMPTDEEIDNWNVFGETSGLGICCGEASNLACIDIDTEDAELGRRLMAIMPHNAPRVIGNPNRPGKYLFRRKEFPNDPVIEGTKLQLGQKIGNKAPVEVFLTNAQIAVPPTIHSIISGHQTYYSWDKLGTGEYPQHDEMPVLTPALVEAVNYTLNGQTPSQVADSVPLGTIDLNPQEAEGRYNYMRKLVAQCHRERMGLDEAVKFLLNEDVSRHGMENRVFMTKERTTASAALNCARWYVNQLCVVSKGKPLDQIEIPRTLVDITMKSHQSFEGWEPPIFPEKAPPLEPFDINMVPEVWRSYVKDAAEANCLPLEACFMFLVNALGSVIGNKKLVMAKKKNKSWRESNNNWFIYVSPSGTRKTQLLSVMSEPLKRLQKSVNATYRDKLREVEALKEIIEPQIKELEKRLKQEAIENLDNGGQNEHVIEGIQTQLSALKGSIKDLPKKQFIINSTTTEKLLEILENNQEGSLMVYNEISELISQFNKKGYETYRQILMDAWDGINSREYQTKNSGNCYIEKLSLGLYGAIQPSIFKRFVDEIAKDKNNDGFWQRPFIVVNTSDKPTPAVDIEFDFEKYHNAYDVFFKAYEIDHDSTPVRANDNEVHALIMQYEEKMNRMGFEEKVGAIGSFWGKFIGKMVKLCSILQFVINRGGETTEISMEAYRMAEYIMDRQYKHIRSLFDNEPVEGFNEIVFEMKTGMFPSEILLSDAKKRFGKYFRNERQSNEMLTELTKRNIIKAPKKGRGYEILISPYISNP